MQIDPTSASETWSAIGAISQILTASASITVAWLAFSFSKKQTHINLTNSLNTLWNQISQMLIQQSPLDVAELQHTIFGNKAALISMMILNVYEVQYLLFKHRVVDKEEGDQAIEEAWKVFRGTRRDMLEYYLNQGFDKEFATRLLEFDKQKRGESQVPLGQPS